METEGWRRTDRAANRTHGLVYMLTNEANGKAYIGLSMVSFKKRMQGHKSKALSGKMSLGCRALNNAIRKYGWERFKKEILKEHVPVEQLPEWERRLIAVHDTLAPRGYNLHPGGQTSPMLHPDVKARAKEVMSSPEVSEKRQKVFSSSTFKERVGKASRESWNACTEDERLARIHSQITSARVRAEDKREAKMAALPSAKAKRVWKAAKWLAMKHAKTKAGTLKPGDTRDPVADTEAWFGPSYEERHYRGKRRTASSADKKDVSECVAFQASSSGKSVPKFRPSVICSGEGASEDRSWMIPSDPED
jgi:group I intron endonuclease